ncbi:hypothetical protein PRIPAC_85795 [Pristionchus pacificus]|uniref:Uncharacterized protein n=1 Tax=Pristionchus pacificus TaxID=54126 RepID=A0A2A6BS11_PRIPA|nr:hypothetical protein PRIPAC_85795 [Pristionchus pacificus]|eukprot:PDM68657.1 hypothetical protein PRIPAC_46959 [Pristionchus pacificus]
MSHLASLEIAWSLAGEWVAVGDGLNPPRCIDQRSECTASTGSPIYRTPITNRRRRTSTCSTGASASSSSTMLVPEPKAPSKEPSRAAKM